MGLQKMNDFHYPVFENHDANLLYAVLGFPMHPAQRHDHTASSLNVLLEIPNVLLVR